MPTVQDLLAALPPWDAAPYFQTPLVSYLTITSAVQKVVVADPMTYGIILAGSTTSEVYVSPNSKVTVNNGIGLAVGQPPLMLTFQDWGPLVQSDWFAIATGSVTMCAIVCKLYRYPVQRVRPKKEPRGGATP